MHTKRRALATLAFFAVSRLPDAQFLGWGWRIPFLARAVLIVIGLVIRLSLSESPDFAALRERAAVARVRSSEKLLGARLALGVACPRRDRHRERECARARRGHDSRSAGRRALPRDVGFADDPRH